MSDGEDLNELIKVSQIDISKFSADVLGKVEKLRTVARFNQARRQSKNMPRSQICYLVGTSASTLQRIRKDVGSPSPYRHSVSTRLAAQKEREKYKRMVYTASKTWEISANKNTIYIIK
jgi:hypothetical protein